MTTRGGAGHGRRGRRSRASALGVLCLAAALAAGGCGGEGGLPGSDGATTAGQAAPGDSAAEGSRPGEGGADEAVAPDPPRREPTRPDEVLEGVWSPDGYRLAVTWDRGPGARLYGVLAGTDSTPPEAGRGLPLSPGRGAWAAWSPDGLWIAYASGGNIRRMRPDGTQDQVLTTGTAVDDHPAFAPDGRRLAFVSRPPGQEDASLWTMAADGSDRRRIPLPLRGSWRAPVWHPTDGTLAAELAAGEAVAVYRVDPERGSAVRLARGGAPAFSPSGDSLYFSRSDSIFRLVWPGADGDPGEAETRGAAGPGGQTGAGAEGAAGGGGRLGGPPELVVEPGRAPHPAPDGRRLAFVAGPSPVGALYLLDLETGDTLRVTSELPPRPARPGG